MNGRCKFQRSSGVFLPSHSVARSQGFGPRPSFERLAGEVREFSFSRKYRGQGWFFALDQNASASSSSSLRSPLPPLPFLLSGLPRGWEKFSYRRGFFRFGWFPLPLGRCFEGGGLWGLRTEFERRARRKVPRYFWFHDGGAFPAPDFDLR